MRYENADSWHSPSCVLKVHFFTNKERDNDMRTTEFFKRGLLACGLAAFFCMAYSARATLDPVPLICFTDNNGNPIVSTANLSEILNPSSSTPTITYGFETIEIQFYSFDVFVAGALGTHAVIIDGPGATPNQIVILNVAQLTGKDSVDIYFADYTAANWSTLLTTFAGSPTITETGSQLDVTSLLHLAPLDGPEICVDCGGSVPDSGPTLVLLGISLVAVILVHKRLKSRLDISLPVLDKRA
jgi:hypothetical protein